MLIINLPLITSTVVLSSKISIASYARNEQDICRHETRTFHRRVAGATFYLLLCRADVGAAIRGISLRNL